MKKGLFICTMAVAMLMAACGGGTKGYDIKGTVESGADGDVVYLAERVGRQYNYLDSAMIAGGTFVLSGQLPGDEALVRYLVAPKAKITTGIIVEPGTIIATLGRTSKITGTPMNEAYGAFNEKTAEIETEEAMADLLREELEKYIATPVGYMILRNNFYYLPYPEIGAYIERLPISLQAEPYMVQLKEKVKEAEKTAVGKPFTDLVMKTPEGNEIKLSDYLGKGKYVLVDFWASWCPPCREETPKLVALYKKYKGDKFEIVGISFDRPEANGGLEAWKKGIVDLGITWPQMSDLKYWDSEGATVYAVSSIPHLMLVGPDGVIMERGLSADKATAKIEELLK
ncbi:MAG: AhpC/TSA family protein [Prevotellaceae bacterium]|jgi:thiol-disulfide isomerase/thioredoxin|nr:AhpC/TSA family protein [Prevotellaceae bacterium]